MSQNIDANIRKARKWIAEIGVRQAIWCIAEVVAQDADARGSDDAPDGRRLARDLHAIAGSVTDL